MTALQELTAFIFQSLHSSSPTVIVSCRDPYLVLDIEKVQTMLQKMQLFRCLIYALFNYRCFDVGRPAGDQSETSSTRTSSEKNSPDQLEVTSKSTALATQLYKASC